MSDDVVTKGRFGAQRRPLDDESMDEIYLRSSCPRISMLKTNKQSNYDGTGYASRLPLEVDADFAHGNLYTKPTTNVHLTIENTA